LLVYLQILQPDEICKCPILFCHIKRLKKYLEILPDNVPYAHGSSKFLKSYRSVKDEPDVMGEADRIGKLIKERIKNSTRTTGDSKCKC